MKPTVGVLALQGGVSEHAAILRRLGCRVAEVRIPEQLEGISAMFLPGGESTALVSLMHRWDLIDRLRRMGLEGLPIFGTCAGAVLLCRSILEREHEVLQEGLGLADVRAVRNYFGRQRRSFVRSLDIRGLSTPFRGIFIRAPLLQPLSDDVEVLSRVEEGPALVRQGSFWLISFHPELTADTRLHELFLRNCGILKGVLSHADI